jgi:hypothetical protein
MKAMFWLVMASLIVAAGCAGKQVAPQSDPGYGDEGGNPGDRRWSRDRRNR